MNNITFSRNLVKGKIAETIFSQMFRDTGNFTVLEFGYEKIVPELVQQGYDEKSEILETLKTAPDFAVINKKSKEIRLIEVKYRRDLRDDDILKCAKRMSNSWNPSYLFLATQEHFYFDDVDTINNKKGIISLLDYSIVSKDLQDKYLIILKDFEANN